MLTNLPLTKLESSHEETDSEQIKGSREREMKTEVSESTTNRSRVLKRFFPKRAKSTRHWKACELAFLALTTVVSVSINAVPTILYLTIEVSARVCAISYRTIHAYDEHILFKPFKYLYTMSYECAFIYIHSAALICYYSTTFCTQRGSNGVEVAFSDAVNCTNINKSIKAANNCSSFSWGLAYPNDSPGNCSAENYTGSVCRQQLLAWQECAFGGTEDVFLDLTYMKESQAERERNVAQFLHFLRELCSQSLFMQARY